MKMSIKKIRTYTTEIAYKNMISSIIINKERENIYDEDTDNI